MTKSLHPLLECKAQAEGNSKDFFSSSHLKWSRTEALGVQCAPCDYPYVIGCEYLYHKIEKLKKKSPSSCYQIEKRTKQQAAFLTEVCLLGWRVYRLAWLPLSHLLRSRFFSLIFSTEHFSSTFHPWKLHNGTMELPAPWQHSLWLKSCHVTYEASPQIQLPLPPATLCVKFAKLCVCCCSVRALHCASDSQCWMCYFNCCIPDHIKQRISLMSNIQCFH